MLKFKVYNYWRDTNNYQQEKNTPTFMCQIKVHKLKKMPQFMGNLDIHFFFILILFMIWT